MPNNKLLIVLFILFSIITAYFIKIEDKTLEAVSRVISLSLLLVYYLKSTNNINSWFVVVLLLFIFSSGVFSLNRKSVLGFVILLMSRSVFLYVIAKTSSKKGIKSLLTVLIPFIITSSIVLTIAYRNNFRFKLAIVIALVMIIIASILFLEVLNTRKKGNIELFLGILLLIFCDALLGLQTLKIPYVYHTIVSLFCYQFAYYSFCKGMIKKDNY